MYKFNLDEILITHGVGRNPFKWVNKDNTRYDILFYIQQEDAKKENSLKDSEEIQGAKCN